MIQLGIIREEKKPSDSRVPFTPKQCRQLLEQYNNELNIVVQPSPWRCFADQEYLQAGITLSEDLSNCNWLAGVKEVPPTLLQEEKNYLFFSHTIKKQAYNRPLLQMALQKNIRLVDYECLTHNDGTRILGFGHFAGIVGAHNGLLVYGKKTGAFDLKPAYQCHNYDEIKNSYKQLQLPPIRMVLTGTGRVSKGTKEVLDLLKITQIDPQTYLSQTFDKPVYTLLNSAELYQRKSDLGYDRAEFHREPAKYQSRFLPFAYQTDLMFNGIYWHPDAPVFFTKEDMRSPKFAIKVIADITCDINGSIPATTRATSIMQPVMGYNPVNEQEEAPYQAHTIDIMAVDNLPNELPRDASEMFGSQLVKHIIPEIIAPQSDIIQRASITLKGKLTDRFEYLQDYAEGNLR